MRTRAVLLVLVLVAAPAARAQDAPATEPKPESDPVFRAMDDEIARAKSLRMKDLDAPYHLSAYVNDHTSFGVSATFGALTREGGERSASSSVDVRVGSPQLDNTNFSSWSFFSGAGAATPSTPDYDALRQALWMKFDAEFKGAVQSMSKKRAYLASNTVKELQPDFAPATTTDLEIGRAHV